MTTRAFASTNVDWEKVRRLTEVPRTFEVHTDDGRTFFKMYKPSDAKRIFRENGWHGELIGVLRRKY